MRKIIMLVSTLALLSAGVFAQGLLDAWKYAQTDLSGTARYLAMGGAFGALGGDISVMGAGNPAGLAIYRSSEVVTSLSFNTVSANTNWQGATASAVSNRLDFDNLAYVGYFPTSNSKGIVGWNAGFSYNRLKNYYRNYTMSGLGNPEYSLSDYIAERAGGIKESDIAGDNPYTNVSDWLSVLGYDARLIDVYSNKDDQYRSAFGENDANGDWTPYSLSEQKLKVREQGATDRYNIAFGLNISDFLLLGANLDITTIDYYYWSYYSERFENANSLSLENRLETEGNGYGLGLGAILRPLPLLRFGLAYHTPTWYKMTDYFSAIATSDSYYWPEQYTATTEDGGDIFPYRFRSPDKWLFSAAVILGQTALISADYELTNYGNMKLFDRDGIANSSANEQIRTHFSSAGTLRIGAELKLTPQWALRAGAAIEGNLMSTALKTASEEVMTVGTIPHYTIQRTTVNYSLGGGYRFTPRIYLDAACLFKAQKEDLYAFSKIFADNKDLLIDSNPASLKTYSLRLALTLGYKF